MQLGYLASLSETHFPLGLLSLFLGPVFIFKGAEVGGGEQRGGHTKQTVLVCRETGKLKGKEDTFSENIKSEEIRLSAA